MGLLNSTSYSDARSIASSSDFGVCHCAAQAIILATGRCEASAARVTPGCWPKLPPIMIIRRRLTCYNSLWDEFPLNAHLLTIHLAADLYTFTAPRILKWGWLQRRSAHGATFVMPPQAAGEIDFEPRVQFTIGLNFRIAYCVARWKNRFTRNAGELIFFCVFEIAVFGFLVIKLAGTLGHWTPWLFGKRTHFSQQQRARARTHTNDSATCVLIMAMKIRRHELFIGQE